MSNKAIDWALSQEIKAPAKPVLLILANRANAQFQCWPGHKTIAIESGFGETTVRRALIKLRAMGLIEWKHRPDGKGGITSNLYSLVLTPRPETTQPPQQERTRPTTGFASTSRLWRSFPPAGGAEETEDELELKPNETPLDFPFSKIGKRSGHITKLKS